MTFIGCVWQKHKAWPASVWFSGLSSSSLSSGQYGAGVQAVQSCSCHLHVFPSRRRQQFCGGQRGRLRLHGVPPWKVGPSQTPSGYWGSVFSPPRTECEIHVAHSPPSETQIQHSISCWLRFLSCPVILFVFSACQLCLQRSLDINRAHMRGKQIILSCPFYFLLCVFLWERVCLDLVAPGRLRQQFHPAMFSFRRTGLVSQQMIWRVKKRTCALNQSFARPPHLNVLQFAQKPQRGDSC